MQNMLFNALDLLVLNVHFCTFPELLIMLLGVILFIRTVLMLRY